MQSLSSITRLKLVELSRAGWKLSPNSLALNANYKLFLRTDTGWKTLFELDMHMPNKEIYAYTQIYIYSAHAIEKLLSV